VVRARSETEAAWLLAEAREGTRPICGGTDLMLHMERGKVSPHGLVDIRRAGMHELTVTDDTLRIGTAATATALSKWAPLQQEATGLWEAAATLSVPTIRNMASVGGNVANASPAADMVPPLMAMGAEVELRKGDDFRLIPLKDYASGPGRTVRTEGELLTRVIVPRWRASTATGAGAFHHFSKLGFRDAQIIAVVSLAISCEMEGQGSDAVVSKVGIALGSVAATVKRAEHVEQFLLGKKLTRATCAEAVALLAQDISPITDVRSEAAFRLQVAQNYLADALARAYVHSQGHDASGASDEARLAALKDPAPRPPSLAGARTRLGFALPAPKLRIVPTSAEAYKVSAAAAGAGADGAGTSLTTAGRSASRTKGSRGTATKGATMAARKKKTTKKKATKRKATKKKTTKRKTKKKTAKKKTAKKKTKKKATKKKATKRKTTKRKPAKKKATKRKATKKKTTKRKPAKKKATKRKPAKKKATKRKATKKKATKRKTAKRKTAKRKTARR
jgi:CO/xanthine dehydrogenase FAD-binding subunit